MNYTPHPNFRQAITSLVICLLATFSLAAQSASPVARGAIMGKLLGESQTEVMYASVALLQNDSLVVGSAISAPTGDFRIEHIAAGSYRLRVDHLEYATYTTEPITVSGKEAITFPEITLTKSIAELGEVVVTYRKPLVEVKADRLVFNVDSSPSASGTNGLDLLRKSPGVSVDMDNNISLLGKSGVRIYINDVPSRLSGDDLVNLLQSISSDNVEAIEIITNPSAKYEAEGNAGIINFVMKRNLALGYNGSLTSSFTQGRYLRNNNSTALNYSGEKLRANLEVTESNQTSFDTFLDTKEQNNTTLDLNSNEISNRQGWNIAAGVESQLGERHLLSLNARGVINQNNETLNSRTDIFNSSSNERSNVLLSQSLVEQPSQNYSANLHHQWRLNSASSLNSALSVGTFSSDRHTEQPNALLAADEVTVTEIDNAEFDAMTTIGLWSAKTDYEREWEHFVLSAGGKYSHISTNNNFAFYDADSEELVLDPTKSNDFQYTEDVAAAYAIVNAKLSPALTLSGGLRVERTDSRGQLISDLPLDNKDVPRTYTDFFPNVGLSYDSQQDHAWSLSLGRRITRPNYQDLNPFETPISQLTVWKGNPFLSPKYTMNYQLSYSYKQKLIVTNTYSVTRDFFASIFEITGTGSNQIIPRNMQRATDYGVSLSYPVEVTKKWTINAFLEGSYATYQGDLEGTVIDLKNTNYNCRLQNSIKLPGNLLLDLTYSVGSDWVWRGSVRVRGNQSTSFGLRKDFFDKQLQLRITGADIFKTTNDYFYRGDYGGILIDGVRSFDTQRFGLGITWKFGNQQAKTRKNANSALDEELNRINN